MCYMSTGLHGVYGGLKKKKERKEAILLLYGLGAPYILGT